MFIPYPVTAGAPPSRPAGKLEFRPSIDLRAVRDNEAALVLNAKQRWASVRTLHCVAPVSVWRSVCVCRASLPVA
jgi:hypothetical protein